VVLVVAADVRRRNLPASAAIRYKAIASLPLNKMWLVVKPSVVMNVWLLDIVSTYRVPDGGEHAKGRFSDIMPQKPQTEENRKMAEHLLLMMGVVPENLGFDPMWN
jgi:hypothetical protein